jgi:hypothetical protein
MKISTKKVCNGNFTGSMGMGGFWQFRKHSSVIPFYDIIIASCNLNQLNKPNT